MTSLNLNSGEDQHLVLRDKNGVERIVLLADERGATINLHDTQGASVELRVDNGVASMTLGTRTHAQAAFVAVTEGHVTIACPSRECGYIKRVVIDRATGDIESDTNV